MGVWRKLLRNLNTTILAFLTIAVALSLTMGATLWGTLVIKRELARERNENLRTLLLHTARVIKPHVKLMVKSEIERVAEELLQFEFIKGVRIVWKEPAIYGDIREMDLLLGRSPGVKEKLEVAKGDLSGEIVSIPIMDGEEVIGRLEVAVNDSLHEALIRHLLERFLLVGLLISLLVSFLLYLYYRLVSRPVLSLANQMERPPEDLTPFPLPDGPKEIRILIEAYNHLVERLRHYREELKAAIKRWQEEANRAEAASRAKTAFLANITHELRTPMTAALGMAELLKETPLDAEQKEYLENLMISLRSLSGLIEEVLTFAKLEAEKEGLREEVFSLRELVAEVCGLFKAQFQKKGLSLRCEVDHGLSLTFKGDQAKLKQILINLLGNALKFTTKGGAELKVALLEEKEDLLKIRFTVSDTGLGIPPEDLERIFVPFERLAPETIPGTGLGLSISRHLARLLGGKLWAESPGPGKGARFHLEVSLKRAVREDSPPSFTGRLSGRVLLAEDNPVTRHYFTKILEKLGLSVVAVEDGKQALSQVEREDFDLLLLDIRMPELDGLEVARRLRARGFRKPILAITAHALSEVEAESLRAGMDGFISKPISREELARRLSRWLS